MLLCYKCRYNIYNFYLANETETIFTLYRRPVRSVSNAPRPLPPTAVVHDVAVCDFTAGEWGATSRGNSGRLLPTVHQLVQHDVQQRPLRPT